MSLKKGNNSVYGLVVNPIAGMGGRVGLKGTDGVLEEARRRGAVKLAPERAARFLRALSRKSAVFLTCAGEMGEYSFRESGLLDYRVIYRYDGESRAEDTIQACRTFLEEGISLLVFCGGDGTARDVLHAVGNEIPVLGIPAGVKMYSGVFALTPEAAAATLESWDGTCAEAEVIDVDEEAYRNGELRTRLYGIARVPSLSALLQHHKQVFESGEEEGAKADIARFLVEVIEGTPETLYLLGPGTTTGRIAEALGIRKTMLGFDAVMRGRLAGQDLDERGIMKLLEGARRTRIIVSPLGAQGAILGRGTQQISPEVLKRIGVENVIVVATPGKLAHTPVLFVDTGDRELDLAFGDSIRVITGYQVARRRRLSTPERS